LKNVGKDGRITLKMEFNNKCMSVERITWLRTKTTDWLLQIWEGTFRVQKRRGIYWPLEYLSASQDRLNSRQLGTFTESALIYIMHLDY
jgi:hypothetical protein